MRLTVRSTSKFESQMNMTMKNKRSVFSLRLGVLGASLFSLSAAAQLTIYDNSVHDLTLRYAPLSIGGGTLTEVGNQISVLRTMPNHEYLMGFSFDFYGINIIHPGSFSGTINAQVRFYQNDNSGSQVNGYNTPWTKFYDSGIFPVGAPTARSTIQFLEGADNIPVGGLHLPSGEFTWTVQFSGLGLGDDVGLDIYNPPVIGNAFDDLWIYNGTAWQLQTYGVGSNAIAARFQSVPEPSSLALLVLGGFGVLIAGRRNRKS